MLLLAAFHHLSIDVSIGVGVRPSFRIFMALFEKIRCPYFVRIRGKQCTKELLQIIFLEVSKPLVFSSVSYRFDELIYYTLMQSGSEFLIGCLFCEFVTLFHFWSLEDFQCPGGN